MTHWPKCLSFFFILYSVTLKGIFYNRETNMTKNCDKFLKRDIPVKNRDMIFLPYCPPLTCATTIEPVLQIFQPR